MTLGEFYKKNEKEIIKAIHDALKEDKVLSDVTTSLFFKSMKGERLTKAVLLCKEDCILSGIDIFKKVFKILYPGAIFRGHYKDGDRIRNKSVVLEVKSPLRILLEGERTALNFVQRMSGIATLTNVFVNRLKYQNAKILHTRKTTPNFRLFELAAVKTGGGDFHRFDLSSSVMIKDNHIMAAGSMDKALEIIRRKKTDERLKNRFEIEVKTMTELKQVVKKEKGIVKIVMLDNFQKSQIPEAVKILKKNKIKTELSGGLDLLNFDKLQQKDIDYYSIGMLTHSYKSADFSLEF